MPEVREVFRMATQEVRPEPDFVGRHHDRQRRRARDRKVGALALVAMLGLLFAVVAIRLLDDDRRSEPAIVPPVGTAPGMYAVDLTTGEDTFIRGVPASPADASPDGSLIAFGRDSGGSSQIFVAGVDGTQAQRVTNDPAEATDPSWSPDGRELAFIGFGQGTDRSVFVVDLETGRTRQLTQEAGDASNPDWSPDGTQILYTVEVTVGAPAGPGASVLRTVDVATGEVTNLTERTVGAADGAWSPDGSTIAFASDRVGLALDEVHGIFLMDADGGGIRSLVADVPAWHPEWSADGGRIVYFAEDAPSRSIITTGTCCNTYVVDVATGESQQAVSGGLFPIWLNDDTLLIELH